MNTDETDASSDNNQPQCQAPLTASISGEFEIQGITVDAAKQAEPTLRKIILKTYQKTAVKSGLLLRHIMIDSITAGSRRRSRRLSSADSSAARSASRSLKADVVVKYTVNNLIDAAAATAAKTAFEKEVLQGDFVTALRNEDQATFGDAKVYNKGLTVEEVASVPVSTSPTPVKSDKVKVSMSIGMIAGIAGGSVAVLLLMVFVMKNRGALGEQQNNTADNNRKNSSNKTKVVPCDPNKLKAWDH
jgi:hypothetical protein